MARYWKRGNNLIPFAHISHIVAMPSNAQGCLAKVILSDSEHGVNFYDQSQIDQLIASYSAYLDGDALQDDYETAERDSVNLSTKAAALKKLISQ